MRRLITVLAAALVVAVLLLGGVGGDDDSYRVNAVFDTAEGVAPGFLVKVAGVEVGSITEVRVGEDGKAHVSLELDSRWGPFASDASCRILPQSLISEKYVECLPGESAEELASEDGMPTVPVSQTSVPVAVQDLLDIFMRPTNDRLRLLLNELGISVAGGAGNINEILRRSNPTLRSASRMLRQVNEQRAELAGAVGQTDTVLAELAARDDDVRAFVSRTADLTSTVAERRTELRAAVRDLPAMLETATSSLTELKRFADAAPPLLGELREAASPLERVLEELPPFSDDAVPAVTSLRLASRTGIPAAESVAPQAKHLKTFGKGIGLPADRGRDLLLSLRDTGAIERIPWWLYNTGAMSSPYDQLGHAAAIQLTGNSCLAEPSTPGCDARFQVQAGDGVPQPQGAEKQRSGKPRKNRKGRGKPGARPPEGSRGASEDSTEGRPGLDPSIPKPGSAGPRGPRPGKSPFRKRGARDLLDYLLEN